jgi:UDP-N-acetylglucosamine:LPS N-acetylglucosamine transferase
MLLRPGFAGHKVYYLTTLPGLAESFGALPSSCIPDCNADTPLRILRCVVTTGWHILRLRPRAVVTTGALPGVIALLWGRLIGAQTLWVDSIANAEELSASGRLARRIAHCTLSQWEAVAAAESVDYKGAVL